MATYPVALRRRRQFPVHPVSSGDRPHGSTVTDSVRPQRAGAHSRSRTGASSRRHGCAAPLARLLRRALPWGAPAHAGPHRTTARSTRLVRHADQCAPSRRASLLIPARGPGLCLARILKLPPWRRPGNPLVLVKHSEGCLKPVRPAKPLKPRRDLRVIQVWMIAAAGADQLIHVGVAALDTAVHDADRLAAQDRIAAVAGLTGGRGCHDLLRHDSQAPVTAIAGTRCGDSGRTGSPARYPSRGQRRQDCSLNSPPGSRSCHYRGLEQRRCYDQTIHAGRAKDMPGRDT